MTTKDQVLALHFRHPKLNSGELARAAGITSPRYVRSILKCAGMTLTNAQHRLQHWERQAIADAYESGEKVTALAAEFNVTVSCIRRVARKAGLPPRNGHEWRAA